VTDHAALQELQQRLGPAARRDEPLARLTSIRVGGSADLFLLARSQSQMISAVAGAEALGVPWRVIGSASNLLISDDGIEGLVIKAGASASEIETGADQPPRVHAEAGCILASVAKRTATAGYGGLEWAVNVPGTVGASVVNNSGAFGSCTAEHLLEASVYVPGLGTIALPVDDLAMTYRATRLKRGEIRGVVLSATYRIEPGDAPTLLARIVEIQRQRRTTQPAGYSVGSVFTNPPGNSAGRIIESLGLKGHRIGDAEVSQLHANFILNRGRASAADVLGLIGHVQRCAWEQRGIRLVPEVQVVGRWRADQLATVIWGAEGPT
jgi:UDP-N-acetylmuramate dehydrogenase